MRPSAKRRNRVAALAAGVLLLAGAGVLGAAEEPLVGKVCRPDLETTPVVEVVVPGGLSAFVAPVFPPDLIAPIMGVVLDDGVPF